MNTTKLHLNYAEFYITNVCNLTCQGCNRFNNVKFKGWQKWNDYKDIYQRWGECLILDSISILGGEPLLNPDFYDWVLGIRKIWPQALLRIASNGTQLDNHQKLYEVLKNDKQILFSVCLHNKKHKQELIEKTKKIMQGEIKYTFDPTPYRECLTLTDSNSVRINIWYNWWFHQGAVIRNLETGRYTLHNSDPIRAHKICHSKNCYHFENGMLHKCGPSSLFKQFDQQFNLDISDQDRQKIYSYHPLSIEDDFDTKKNFLDNLENPIDLCKFCPEVYQGQQIFAQEKKSL